MRQNITYIVLLLICTLFLCTGTVSAKVVTVGTDLGNSTISAALVNATDGDTIIVKDGTYYDSITVVHSMNNITIRSENGAEHTIINAKYFSGHVFNITANNVTIDGFTITGATVYPYAGIYMSGNSNCTISNNSITGNNRGVYLSSSSSNNLTGNDANSNSQGGIHLSSSSSNKLTNNNASNNDYYGIYLSSSNSNNLAGNNVNNNSDNGISLYFSSNNSLTGNNATDNDYGIYFYSSGSNKLTGNIMSLNTYNLYIGADLLADYDNDINVSNLVNNKSVYYLFDRSDEVIPSTAGIVYAINSSNITVNGANISNECYGIYFYETRNSTIKNATISDCNRGIYLYKSSSNNLTGNNASENNYGISLSQSASNNLTGNYASENNYGIELCTGSVSNKLTENIMSSNTYNLYIDVFSLHYSSNDIDVSNLVDNKSVYYLVGHSDEVVPSTAGVVYAIYSINITVSEVNISNEYYGIYFYNTKNSTIENAMVSDCDIGIYLYSSNSNNLTGNNASNNSWNGIYLAHSGNNNIINNNAGGNDDGIGLYYSTSNKLTNNNVSNNVRAGIYLEYSGNNNVTNNNARGNNIGIRLYDSDSNKLVNNNASNNDNYGISLSSSGSNNLTWNIMSLNTYNLYIYASSLHDYDNDINVSNLVDNKSVYYLFDHSDAVIPSTAGVVYAINSSNITVNGANISNEYYGILFYNTNNSTIENVTVSNCNEGIELDISNNNDLINNNASNNDYHGISLSSSSSNNLTGNNANDNYYGIDLYKSRSNTLFSNTMSDNQYSFDIYGDSIEYYYNDIAANNSVNGKPVYYLVNCSDKIVPYDAGLAYAINSTNITVNGAKISDEFWGVLFINTQNSTIEDVTVSNCYYGIYIKNSSNSNLSSNIAINNSGYDLCLVDSSTPCIINDLTVTENGAQVSFSADELGTGIKGTASYSTALSGKTNVNGYVSIQRASSSSYASIGSLSMDTLESGLSTEDLTFIPDDLLETLEPSARTLSFTSDNISVDSSDESPIQTLASDSTISVTFSYDDSGMSSSGESSIDLYMFNGFAWMALNGASPDTSNNSISVDVSGSGKFALFGDDNMYLTGSSSGGNTGGTFTIREASWGGNAQQTTTMFSTNSNGEVTADTVAKSPDFAATVTVHEGTVVGTDSSGNPVTEITISTPISIPEGSPANGLYYDFGPSGTTFSEAVTISIEFDPENYDASNPPVIYTYDEDEGCWVALETTIDWENGIATAYTTHFSLYALFGADEENTQVAGDSSAIVGEEVPVEQNASRGYLYWILGICIILGLGIVVVNKQKGKGEL